MIPTCSQDVREQREAEEEARAIEQALDDLHQTVCGAGWLGEDALGRPIACPRCHPHLDARPALAVIDRHHLTATSKTAVGGGVRVG